MVYGKRNNCRLKSINVIHRKLVKLYHSDIYICTRCDQKITVIFKFHKLRMFDFFCYVGTYIIGHFNLSVRIIYLVSHTTYVVCVNFIHKWRDLQFKRQIFSDNFHGSFNLPTKFLPEIYWEEIAEEMPFFVFCFDSGLGFEPWLYV